MTSQPETGKIYQGDCLEIMSRWPDGFIDLVLTDPPYNLDGSDIIDFRDGQTRRQNFSARIGNVDEAKVSQALARMLAPKGVLIIWMADRQMMMWWDGLSKAGLMPRYTIIWAKTNPMPQLNRCRPTHAHELAIVATHPANWGTWNGSARDSTIWSFGQSSGLERPDHPCPKPLNLFARAIRLYVKPDGIVLDPFMGSGTTGVICARAGIKFIGVEINSDYVAMAERRISIEMAQGKLL